jgi:hypothetical protein
LNRPSVAALPAETSSSGVGATCSGEVLGDGNARLPADERVVERMDDAHGRGRREPPRLLGPVAARL